jgi:hypothetical protein
MKVMGTNTWEHDVPARALMKQSLRFAEGVKAQGIAELLEAYIAPDQKLLWCTWETNDLKALEAAFAEMNKQSGLKSKLEIVDKYYPE